jgi:hypothetical protein
MAAITAICELYVTFRRCPRRWTLQQRLDHYSIRDAQTGCVLWTGCRDSSGYGKLKMAGKLWSPHRASWVAARGPIPDGLFVCHKCDVRTCINPDHLFLGTHAENMADRVAKLRRTTPPVAKAKWRPEKSPEIMRIEMLGREFVTRVLAIRPLDAAVSARTPRPAGQSSRAASGRRRPHCRRGPAAPRSRARGW